ncbi:hypothetical protein QYE76_017648, partial [Lolium multiflorum]
MKISGDKAAAPPGLAVGSHKERDDGIDNQHQESFKGVAELGAAKAGRIAGKAKGAAEHRAEKAGWVAAEHGAYSSLVAGGYISPEELREKVEKAWASLQIQIGIENEAEYAYEKGNMDLDLHHPGYDCCRKHENKESGFKSKLSIVYKLEESGAEIAGSRTLFMGNIPFTSKHKELEDFFEGIGQITNIRIATHPEGKSKGFSHVEFTTAEAAQKALTLNGKELIGRPVKLDRAADFYVQSRSKGMERVAIPEAE